MNDLEVWLIGTSAELDAAVAALTALGVHLLPDDPADHPQRHALLGADHGRYRLYLRIAVKAEASTTAATRTAGRRPRAESAGQNVIELDAYRRTA